MSSVGAEERPTTVFLVEWTDIFGTFRRALSLQRRDLESMRTTDPDARLIEGHVEWKDAVEQ